MLPYDAINIIPMLQVHMITVLVLVPGNWKFNIGMTSSGMLFILSSMDIRQLFQ